MEKYDVVLITGAAGFIGSSLVKKFLSVGFKVFGVDNINDYYDTNLKKDRLKEIDKCADETHSSWKFFKASIEDKKGMEEIFKFCKPQLVVNLAAQAGVRYSIENPSEYTKTNLVGFSVILELCKFYDVEHLVYASSSSVYGANNTFPFSEDQKTDTPLSFYAATKISNEMMANSYSHIYSMPITGLRYFTVYGPWGRPDMAPMIFASNIFCGKPISVFNYGKMSRDFTYISDIVEGTFLCCLKPPTKNNTPLSVPHKVFNIGNGNPVELLYFIELLEDSFSVKAKKILKEIQPGDIEKTYANTSSLFEWVGYKPKVNIENGIKNFVDWFLKYYS